MRLCVEQLNLFMKKITIIIIILITILAVVYIFLRGDTPVRDSGTVTNLPNDTTQVIDGTPRNVEPDVITIRKPDGTLFNTGSILTGNNSEEISDNFYSLGFDLVNTKDDYTIYYYADSATLFVLLFSEPLVESRKAAEQDLLSIVSSDKNVLCDLNISVRTNQYVNQWLGGQELGLSFCPGSVLLE